MPCRQAKTGPRGGRRTSARNHAGGLGSAGAFMSRVAHWHTRSTANVQIRCVNELRGANVAADRADGISERPVPVRELVARPV